MSDRTAEYSGGAAAACSGGRGSSSGGSGEQLYLFDGPFEPEDL